MAETVYLEHGKVLMPSKKITVVDPDHRYEAARGYSASLVVFDKSGKCIGWIDTRTLGFETAKEWMARKKA